MRGIQAIQLLAILFAACDTPAVEDHPPVVIEQRGCGAVEPDDHVKAEIEEDLTALHGASGTPQPGSVHIPVWFHVIRKGAGFANGDLSQPMIDDQLDAMNAAYAETPFVFDLVAVDRTTNTYWFSGCNTSTYEPPMKHALRRGGSETLNLYSCNPSGGFLGTSTFPSDYAAHPTLDGVTLLYTTLPGGPAGPYDEGDTAVHETGHWLGLYHTFQGGCSKTNDYVADTAPERAPAYGCPVGRDSCVGGGGDPIYNYMDFVDDACMSEFSTGQTDRMWTACVVYRL